MDIPIAVTVYKNYELLKNCTLTYLAKYKYPSELITLFVESEEEEAKCRKVIPTIFFNNIIVADRKSINKHYKEGEIVIHMEDNVKDIKSPYLTFNQIVLHAKNLLDSNNCGLFGIIPHDDVKGMMNTHTTQLEYISKSFYICKNHKSIQTTVNNTEDYERSILYFLKYGKVIKYRGAGISLEKVIRPVMLKEYESLVSKYPMMSRVIKIDGIPEIMLNMRIEQF
jgi:hypothetical protein